MLVVIERYSKYGYFIALSHSFCSFNVERVFMYNIYKLYGLLKRIVSDRDKIFLSNFWKELFKHLQAQLLHSSTYYPQIGGKTKRLNKCLEN